MVPYAILHVPPFRGHTPMRTLWQGNLTILVALATADAEYHPLAIDVADLQMQRFGISQTAAVHYRRAHIRATGDRSTASKRFTSSGSSTTGSFSRVLARSSLSVGHGFCSVFV